MSESDTVVYACTFLDYDVVLSPLRPMRDAAHVLFSDRRPRFTPGWSWRPLPEALRGLSQAEANRWCKFFPHRLFPQAQRSVYIDGNMFLRGDLAPHLARFMASGADIALFRHAGRATLEQEIDSCVAQGKLTGDAVEIARRQVATYRAEGLPADIPLSDNCVLVRRHDASALDAAMTLWWEQLRAHSRRDQLSLPYVLHRTGLTPYYWDWTYRTPGNGMMEQMPHRTGWALELATHLHALSAASRLANLALTPARAAAWRLARIA